MAGSYCNRRPWGQQKPPLGYQLDRSSPFAQGLVGCWLFNEGAGGIANDLCDIKILNGVTYTDVDAKILAPVTLTNGNIPNTGAETWVFSGYTNTANKYPSLISSSTAADGKTGLYIECGSDASGYFVSLCETAGTRKCYRYWSKLNIVGNNIARAAVYNNNTATLNLYSNGILTNGSLSGTVPTSQVQTTDLIFSMSPSQAQYLNRYYLMRWLRALTAAEVSYLYANPYDMVEGWNYARWYSIPSGMVFSPIWYQNSLQDVA